MQAWNRSTAVLLVALALIRVLIVHAREEWAIARECWRLASAKA